MPSINNSFYIPGQNIALKSQPTNRRIPGKGGNKATRIFIKANLESVKSVP